MKKLLGATLLLALAGCAHNIKISSQAPTSTTSQKSKTPVGYYISTADKNLKVTTPGGGGDKVSYQLTKDMEFGFYGALTNSYDTVTVLENSHDAAQIKSLGLSLIFEPKFSSTSSGSSLLTWPADKFSITVNCKVFDKAGSLILDKNFVGKGEVTNAQALSDFAAAANAAAVDVLAQLKKELGSNPILK